MSTKTHLSNVLDPDILYVFETDCPCITEDIIQSEEHTHDIIELSIILAGNAHYTIENKLYTATRGDILILNPNVYHAATLPAQQHYADLHIGINHLLLPNGDLNILKTANASALFTLKDDMDSFFSCCNELIREKRLRKSGYSSMLKLLTTKLIILLYRQLRAENTLITDYNGSVGYPQKKTLAESMMAYINEHYMNDISLDMFSKDMYLSQVYLSKIFKEEIGTSPINYLIKTRLSKAKILLETTDLPVRLVAHQVGYDDMYHFSKLFKKYYGTPPSKFANLHKEDYNKKG